MKYISLVKFFTTLFVMGWLSSSPVLAQIAHDPDSQIVVRRAPIMPPAANRSGECKLSYDITATGNTTNIHVLQCTQTLFANTSARALERWKYKPVVSAKTGVEVTLKYHMVGEDGKKIPALPLQRRSENPEVLASLKSGGKKLKSKHKLADNFCCLNHSVGADGGLFNRVWTCPYKGNRVVVMDRLAKMTFKPAMDGGKPVVSDDYQSIFWFHKGKAYTGSPEDRAYCTAE